MFSLRRQYAPLPASTSARRRWPAVAVLAAAACVLLVWLARRLLFAPPPYSPLADYQHLDPPPLLHDAPSDRRAFVSTLYSDSYAIGAAVLLHSLKAHNTSAADFLLAYLPGRISNEALCVVRAAGWSPLPVPFIPPPPAGKGIHHRFVDQYTKLNIWAVPAARAVYLDADTLVLRNIDELFALPWAFAAAPDVFADARGFTIQFNAGVLAYAPDARVLARMKAALDTARYPPAQAEQAFLNAFFAARAARLPYAYNANLAIKRAAPAMWRAMRAAREIAVVHYTLVKPFVDARDPSGRMLRDAERLSHVLDEAERAHAGEFRDEVRWWREVYEDMIAGPAGEDIDRCRRDALVV
ncbi:hypothetical protein C0993_011558 [Termitomyces sp. T159_Od127]|nr:hypothetical protein C0993_011558 [Termitomyces sp. T159_Od127]